MAGSTACASIIASNRRNSASRAPSSRWGAGHIELLQPTDPDKPAGRFLARNGEGVYLVGFETKDVAGAAEHLKKQGVKVDQRGDKIAWVHPRESHGLFVELRKRESYD